MKVIESLRIHSDVACGLATLEVVGTGKKIELVYVRSGVVEASQHLYPEARYFVLEHFRRMFGKGERGDPTKLPCTTEGIVTTRELKLAWFPDYNRRYWQARVDCAVHEPASVYEAHRDAQTFLEDWVK